MRLFITSILIFCACNIASSQPMHDQIRWQNKTRKFIKYIPQDYVPGESLPLVINMHPFLGTGSFQMKHTRFNRIAEAERIIVVYPYGLNGRWNSGPFAGLASPIDDVGFLSALIDYMAVLYNIDTRRVYATGYSAGGFMSYRLGCELTNRIAAIAPVSSSMNPETLESCIPARPLPAMIYNGTSDAIVPWEGFPEVGSEAIETVVGSWVVFNGCDAEPQIDEIPDIDPSDNTTITQFVYNNCDDGAELILNRVNDGGHTWPGRNFPLIGNTSMDLPANETIWEFFSRHSIPEDIACPAPSGLTSDFDGGTASLYWDAVPGIDFYSIIYILPDGELEFIENISQNTLDISVNAEKGELAWKVRSQCNSGHVSWSVTQEDDISARLSTGRLAMFTYPNPASTELHIEFFEGNIPNTISIINSYGHEVRSIEVSGKEFITLDISGLDDGIFHIITGDHSYSARTFRKW